MASLRTLVEAAKIADAALAEPIETHDSEQCDEDDDTRR
jgi:hypothetical protein